MLKYNNDGKVEVKLYFSKSDVKQIRTKFPINNNTDLNEAIFEMLQTYLELD